MHVIQPFKDTCRIKSSPIMVQLFFFRNNAMELSSHVNFSYHIQKFVILESINHSNNEGRIQLNHNVLFSNDSFNLIKIENYTFAPNFQRINLICFGYGHKPHLTKGTSS